MLPNDCFTFDFRVFKFTLLIVWFYSQLQLILDRIAKEISNKVNSGSPMQKALFHFVYEYKRKWTQRGYRTPLFDLYVQWSHSFIASQCNNNGCLWFFRLIFKKITKVLGGRVRELMSGGAPLSAETQEFIKLCLCCNIRQGYGLTESTSGATTMDGQCKWMQFLQSFHFINTILCCYSSW